MGQLSISNLQLIQDPWHYLASSGKYGQQSSTTCKLPLGKLLPGSCEERFLGIYFLDPVKVLTPNQHPN